jgi:hypothetical protein
MADVILDPYRDAKPFVVQPMPGAEKVPVICIIPDLLTEPGKPLFPIVVTFPAVFLCVFLVKDRQQQAQKKARCPQRSSSGSGLSSPSKIDSIKASVFVTNWHVG